MALNLTSQQQSRVLLKARFCQEAGRLIGLVHRLFLKAFLQYFRQKQKDLANQSNKLWTSIVEKQQQVMLDEAEDFKAKNIKLIRLGLECMGVRLFRLVVQAIVVGLRWMLIRTANILWPSSVESGRKALESAKDQKITGLFEIQLILGPMVY